MQSTTRTTLIAVFENRHDAQRAVDELRRAGFREDEIGVAAREGDTPSGTGSLVAEGAVAGAAAGAGVGALWALGIASGLLPPLGMVVAGGLLASVLASAAGGAAVAGLVGALIGLGISEEDAKYYEGEFHAGRTIVTVQSADGRLGEALAIARRHNGYDRATAPAAREVKVGSEEVLSGRDAAGRPGGSVNVPVAEGEFQERREDAVPLRGR